MHERKSGEQLANALKTDVIPFAEAQEIRRHECMCNQRVEDNAFHLVSISAVETLL